MDTSFEHVLHYTESQKCMQKKFSWKQFKNVGKTRDAPIHFVVVVLCVRLDGAESELQFSGEQLMLMDFGFSSSQKAFLSYPTRSYCLSLL